MSDQEEQIEVVPQTYVGYEYMSHGEQVAVALSPSLPAVLSLFGSGVIICMILKDWQVKKTKVKYRFLFMLSIADILNSVWFVAWPLPFPKGYPGIWGASGNQPTCNAMGFFLQMGVMGAFYNAALSHFFFMLLCRRLPERDFAKTHEPYIHAVCLGFPIGTSVAALCQNLYAPGALGCWISPQPRQCLTRDDIECERARWGVLFGWLYIGAPLILLLVYIGYCMFGIYHLVKEVSEKAEKWTSSQFQAPMTLPASAELELNNLQQQQQQEQQVQGDDGMSYQGRSDDDSYSVQRTENTTTITMARNRASLQKISVHAKRTKEAGTQAYLYVGAYLVTHLLAFVVFHVDLFAPKVPSWLMILENVSWPLQGALNMFIFLRPRIQHLRKHDEHLNYFLAVYISLFYFDESNPEKSLDRSWILFDRQGRRTTRFMLPPLRSSQQQGQQHLRLQQDSQRTIEYNNRKSVKISALSSAGNDDDDDDDEFAVPHEDNNGEDYAGNTSEYLDIVCDVIEEEKSDDDDDDVRVEEESNDNDAIAEVKSTES